MAIIQTAHGAINQYMGARYVPKLMDDWSENIKYDYLNQVNYFGDAYISKKPVPLGTPPTDTEYWMRFPYGARLDEAFAQIAAANKRIDKNAGDIGDLQDFTTALNGRLEQAESGINENTRKIASVQAELTDHKTKTQQSFRDMKTEMDRNDAKHTDVETSLRNDLNALTTEVNQSQSDLTGLTGRMTTAEGKIVTLENTANTQGTNISQLQSTVASHTQSIAGLKDSESNLLTRVGANESSIVKLQAEDTALDARIESLEDTSSKHEVRIYALENYYSPEQIGYIDVTYPPADSGLNGIPNDGTGDNVDEFNRIIAYASSKNYGIQFGSGNFNLSPAVNIPKNVYLKGLGQKSVVMGKVSISGETGRLSIIDSIEFSDTVEIGIDTKIKNCIFRNSNLRLKNNQIQIESCNFYHTNSNVSNYSLELDKPGNHENIIISNCLFIAEPNEGTAINANSNIRFININNCNFIGFHALIRSGKFGEISINNCNIYTITVWSDDTTPLVYNINDCIITCPLNVAEARINGSHLSADHHTINNSQLIGCRIEHDRITVNSGWVCIVGGNFSVSSYNNMTVSDNGRIKIAYAAGAPATSQSLIQCVTW